MGTVTTVQQPVGILDNINMDTVRTILAHPYPYPHQHSQHAIIAVFVGCLFFISSDNMHTLIQKLDKNFKWWSIYLNNQVVLKDPWRIFVLQAQGALQAPEDYLVASQCQLRLLLSNLKMLYTTLYSGETDLLLMMDL